MRPRQVATRQKPSIASGSIAFVVVVLIGNLACPFAVAQLPQTRLFSIFPTGGQAGTTVELTLTSGTDLEEIDRLVFNHPGIRAEPKMSGSQGNRSPVSNTFLVEVDAETPAGSYEVRAAGLFGLSNPRRFVVGTLPELQEVEPNQSPSEAMAISINTVVNGRSNKSADVDYFKFEGRRGDRVLLNCEAVAIDSKMQPNMELFDAGGKRLATTFGQQVRYALLDCQLPDDGQYTVKVFDVVYGGSSDYGYRLALHNRPHVDFILPPSGRAGKTAKFTVYGRNLPGGRTTEIECGGKFLEAKQVEISLPGDGVAVALDQHLTPVEAGMDGVAFDFPGIVTRSSSQMVYLAQSDVTLEVEPNDQPENAQPITVPLEVAGQFQKKSDIDYVVFEAKAKEVFQIDVFAQRIGTGADPVLTLQQLIVQKDGQVTTKTITAQDDNTKNLLQNHFHTRSDDPSYRFVAPAAGQYRIALRDRYYESRGNPRLIYRLAIRKEKPDFRLVALPLPPLDGQNNNTASTWSVNLRKGDNYGVRVLAYRRDGFNQTIEVSAKGLPDGVECRGASLGPGQTSAMLIFSAKTDAPEWMGPIEIVGRTRFDDGSLRLAMLTAQDRIAELKASMANIRNRVVSTESRLEKSRGLVDSATAKVSEAKTALDGAAAAHSTAVDAADWAKRAESRASSLRSAAEQFAKTLSEVADASLIDLAKALEQKQSKGSGEETVAAAKQTARKNTELSVIADNAFISASKQYETTAALAHDREQKRIDAAAVLKTASANAEQAEARLKEVASEFNKIDVELRELAKIEQVQTAEFAKANDANQKATASYQKSVSIVSRSARPATIVWNGDQNIIATSRVAESICLAVMEESAPYDIQMDEFRLQANQGRQFLIPVELSRRNGFSDEVKLTAQGLPKNAKVQLATIPKDQDTALVNLFVASNTPVGSYTVYLRSEGKVSYRRNPQKAERAKSEQTSAAKLLADATALRDKTKSQNEAANQKVAEAKQKSEQLLPMRESAAKELANLRAKSKLAEEALAESGRLAAESAAIAEQSAANLQRLKQLVEQGPDSPQLTSSLDAAEKAADAVESVAARAKRSRDLAQKELEALQSAETKASEQLEKADQQVASAKEQIADLEKAATESNNELKKAEAELKQAQANKQSADKQAKAATDAAKPKNITVYAPSTPLVLEVNPAPVTLAASVPNKGEVSAGKEVAIPVKLKRAKGFSGPVQLSLFTGPNATGLHAPVTEISAEKDEGVLKIKVQDDVTEASFQNLAVRGTTRFQGPAVIDVPIALKLAK